MKSTYKKNGIIVSSFTIILILISFFSFYEFRKLAVLEAEKEISSFLLNHRAIHQFVEQVQLPEIYQLKDSGKLYNDFFTPKLLSFTYIGDHIKDVLNKKRLQTGLEEIQLRLASKNPRNAANSASTKELALLEKFNTTELAEYKEIIKGKNSNILYYAIPMQPNKKSCLRCHGDPADAPQEMIDKYGDQAGFHEKAGDIRGLISVRMSMDKLFENANKSAMTISSLSLGLLVAVLCLVLFFQQKVDMERIIADEKSFYLNSILQSSTDTAIVAVNANFNVMYFNAEAERIFGFPAAEAIGKNVREFHSKISPKAVKGLNKAIDEVKLGNVHHFTLSFRQRSLDARISAIMDPTGVCSGFLLMAHDISETLAAEKEREKMKNKLQEALRYQSLNVMAGAVAHHFNNIMMTLQGNLELLQLETATSTETHAMAKNALDASKKASKISSSMLTYVGQGQANKQPSDLNELLIHMQEQLRLKTDSSIQFEYHMTQDQLICNIDTNQIRQIILNLVINAAESLLEPGGTIAITTGSAMEKMTNLPSPFHYDNLPAGTYAHCEIADNGCGMDAETIGKIFEPFFSTKSVGRGLSLAVVVGILKSHNGALTVTSSPGNGTKMRFFLPLHETKTENRSIS